MPVVVLGVGNVLMSDEGVGVRAADLLRERAPPGVRVLSPGAIGPKTVSDVEGATHLLVLDCVDVGREPGTVVSLDTAGLAPSAVAMSVHEFGVKDLVVLLGQRGSAPASVVVVGVQPANVAPGLELSSEVEAAMPTLVEAALGVLEAWS